MDGLVNFCFHYAEFNRSARYHPDGDVYKLYSELEKIFERAEIMDMPYKRSLDGYGLYVDEGILVLPEEFF